MQSHLWGSSPWESPIHSSSKAIKSKLRFIFERCPHGESLLQLSSYLSHFIIGFWELITFLATHSYIYIFMFCPACAVAFIEGIFMVCARNESVFIVISLVVQKLLSLIMSHLFSLLFLLHLGDKSRKILLQFMLSVLPMFSPRSCIISNLTVRSLINFIFVYSVMKCSNLIFVHVAV